MTIAFREQDIWWLFERNIDFSRIMNNTNHASMNISLVFFIFQYKPFQSMKDDFDH